MGATCVIRIEELWNLCRNARPPQRLPTSICLRHREDFSALETDSSFAERVGSMNGRKLGEVTENGSICGFSA